MLEIAKEYGMPALLETSTLSSEDLISRLNKYRDFLYIGTSLDYITPENLMSSDNSKELLVVRSISMLASSGFEVIVDISLYEDNLGEVESITEFVIEGLHVSQVKLSPEGTGKYLHKRKISRGSLYT